MNNSNQKSILPFFASIFIVGLIFVALSAYQLKMTEFAVVTTFGKPKVVDDPGLHLRFPWPIQKVVKLDQRKQLFTGQVRETPTQDNINVMVNVFAIWRITDPLLYFNSVGSKYEADLLLKSLIESKQEIVIRNHPLSDFLASTQKNSLIGEIEKEIYQATMGQAKKLYGIQLDSIGFSQLSLHEDNAGSVLARMKQQQTKIASKIRSTSEKEAKIIRDNANSEKAQKLAEAEAEAKKTRGEALIKAAGQYDKFKEDLDFAIFLRKLDALEETMKTKTTIILDPKTPPYDLLQLDLDKSKTNEQKP